MAAEICVAGFLSRLDRGSLRSGTVVVLFRSCRNGNRDSGCLGHLIPFCRFALRSYSVRSRPFGHTPGIECSISRRVTSVNSCVCCSESNRARPSPPGGQGPPLGESGSGLDSKNCSFGQLRE